MSKEIRAGNNDLNIQQVVGSQYALSTVLFLEKIIWIIVMVEILQS